MKSYTYPAVFYKNEDYGDYAVEFSDLCIYAEGDTMEEVYKNAQDYLIAYLDCCDELGVAPNKPDTYESTLKDHPNGKIMLVTVDYEPKKRREKQGGHLGGTEKKPTETFTNLNDDIVEDIETSFGDGENAEIKEILKHQVKKQADDGGVNNDGDDGDFALPEIE